MGTVATRRRLRILKKGTAGGGGARCECSDGTGNYHRLTFWPESRVARTACLARLLAVYSLPALYSRRRLFFSACRSAPSRFALAAQRAFGWLLLLLLLHAVLLLLSALRSLFSRSLLLSSFFPGAFKYTDTMRPALPSKDELKDVQELLSEQGRLGREEFYHLERGREHPRGASARTASTG